jgi:parallel beta-helix repeat protein
MPASRKVIVRRVASLSLAALFAVFALGSIAAHADVPDWADCHATSSCDTTTTVAPDTTTTVAPDTTTTTTEPATTTTTAPATTCSGVSVSPGANVQNVLNAYGTGTTFCFQPGTYVLTGFIVPKSYDRLISVVPRGAVFTGLDTYNAGVHGYGGSAGQHDVLFQGFVVTHMANSMTTDPHAALSVGWNWDIENNEVSYNAQVGVAINDGSVLNGNFIHHNGRWGFEGGPSTNMMISNNELSWNNAAHYDINNAGGSKIHKSSYVTFRSNNVHDNYGNGLHTDTDNIHITYEYNTVINNYGIGIFHECSYDAVIRNNTLSGNDHWIDGKSIYWGGDIQLNDSQNVEVYNNTVIAGVHGISLFDVDRGSGAYGTYQVANDYVHDNTVTLPSGAQTGLVGSRAAAYESSSGNVFSHNTYYVTDATASSWIWGSSDTWSQWQGTGNDTTGSLYLSAP